MIRSLRKAHFSAWIILAVILSLAFAASLGLRKKEAVMETIPGLAP